MIITCNRQIQERVYKGRGWGERLCGSTDSGVYVLCTQWWEEVSGVPTELQRAQMELSLSHQHTIAGWAGVATPLSWLLW